MSDEKIDHAAEAVRVAYLADNYDRADHFTGAVGVSIGVESLVQAQIAQVHATLALVEQQRIANLIALASSEIGELVSTGMGGLTEHQPHPDYGDTVMVPALRAEIRKGLGL